MPRSLEEIKVAAALDAPDFEDMVRRALLANNVAVDTELHAHAASLTTFARCVYVMAIREAGAAARAVGDNAGSRTTFTFGIALEDFAESIDPRKPEEKPAAEGLYPPGWPRCACGDFCLDGKATCGRVKCGGHRG